MQGGRTGDVAVIFMSVRTAQGEAGYGAAADAMEALAAAQPGYRGMENARGPDGFGITVSFWADEAAAKAWRDHPEHKAIRDAGRDQWYSRYEVAVGEIDRSYRWSRS
ncbi:antibiotic biosynthesis monooxygenase family protein [Sphingomonas sp. GlSt437]|uniref:antibiotic biosynthesis monooxygenase family protein n=1 Tax=Sphingomonas sp. GlSt437 TaxID=3389970 RepID=UPI003A87A893